ncbi:peptidoglycan D,D-transpeptidase FtsI family protein, partial [Ilumatobacter nonamiensis]|uniref:peptidoglycan D,D-transpeptidase FtsI family protein n=1 Tax=Ilumatobacter nonamiensis TaxID=467093 RepID=UPI0019D3B4C3
GKAAQKQAPKRAKKRTGKPAQPKQKRRQAPAKGRRRSLTPPRGTKRRPQTRAQRHEAVRRRISAPRPEIRAREQKSGKPRRRLLASLAALSLLLVVIVGRVVMLKTTDAESLRSAGAEQWERTADVVAQRGTIFDRNGSELAMSVPAAAISINPKLIENGPATIQLLDDLLDLPDDQVDDLLGEVEAKDRGFVYVKRQVDDAVGDQIAALNRPGINVDAETRREMPGGDTGQTVLGRTNIDGEGIAGLELQYDDILTGSGGAVTREIAPGGRTVPGSETYSEKPVAGDDLVLTIDRSIQFATEQVLIDRVTEINARGGFIVAMDSNTGEIYANASVRRDDAGLPVVTSGNFVAVDSYEPGSVAKVITVAGALNEGVVTPETSFQIPGWKEYYDVILRDAHPHGLEAMSVHDILVESSNLGTIRIQEEMGEAVHYDYMTDFGLGEVTDLDFPGESPGVFKPLDELWGSERVTVAYGQGMSSTPLQMVAAINTIANDGVYVAPSLVRETVASDGTSTPVEPAATRRVVSEEAARQTAAMMEDVVCSGTASRAAVEGLAIAGKTGTAFKAADNGTYYDENGNRIYYSSFAGFYPADDPEVTVLVALDEPAAGTDDRFGGTAAAPVFADLTPTIIHELEIQPSATDVGCEEP